ncbi:LysM peptidoglycan-binding domain-containing protein [Patescibacteria group bacterium]|nr:LysM peptidoglycan-binding domain-containing protein [Patescibacteria group bacterium]MBU1931574.1 LysM peptidoglycan-binding domain-containing protein [Patescibacteria group bacterium]
MEKFFKSIFKKARLNESTLSMILGALVVVVVGILIFNYFAKTEEQVVVEGEVSEFGEMVMKEEGTTPDGLPSKHTVAKGEHLWEIAEKYYDSGYNWVDIAETNNLADANILLIGQELTIPQAQVKQITVKPQPTSGYEYSVQAGDNLWQLAVEAYGDGFRWTEIAEANGLANPNYIEIGQTLLIP